MSRKGTSLFELMVALVLTGLLAALTWSILAAAAFRLRDRSERISMDHALRVAAGAARAALEPLGRDSAAGADLLAAEPDGFVARATRGVGVLCAAAPDELSARAGPGWWVALRAPVAGRDSLLVGTVRAPWHWIALELPADPVPGRCPDGSPAIRFAVSVPPAALAALGPGSPIHVFEDVELKVYTSGAAGWVGLRALATGESIQPLAGPFGTAGLQVAYAGRSGAPTVLPGGVASALIRLGAFTERAGGVGMARLDRVAPDSVALFVALRNLR
jgi:hypothetical protein